MKDSRFERLAENLINYSVELKKGEKILIESHGEASDLVKSIVNQAYKVGGIPFVKLYNYEIQRVLLSGGTEGQVKQLASFDLAVMKEMNAYISIRASENINEMSGVPEDRMQIYNKHYSEPVHSGQRVNHTKWCILRYPNHSMAQLAQMYTEEFEDFYFNVCNLDYSKMGRAMDSLVKLMESTDKVRLTGRGTDITFSIKGLPAIKASGHRNIPDGEVYSAPVRDSVNGVISYNAPSVYQGFTFDNVRLSFENGKIVEAIANDTEKINKILDTDEGARYVGEFAIGLNPYINNPMKDILFDEKINGSIHFTPGQCYKICDNGNHSAIHWDLVFIQRPEYGGGEIYFDDRLIRKDGRFIIPELEALNPENLK